MIIENSDALKVWLTSCLGRMCDADPAALAKYVLALVKKEKTENELREFCLDQLEVFLMKDTKQFVDLLFETLKTKSYLHRPDVNSGATDNDAPVNSSKKLGSTDLKEKSDSERDLQKSENVPKSKPVHISSNSRTHSHSKGVSGRAPRERRDRNHRSRSHSSSSRSSRSSSRERLKEKSDSYKHKQDHPKVEDRHREMVIANTGFAHTPYHLNNLKRSNRCKDYDEKGYCMQGDLCIYDHGTDPVVLENVSVMGFGPSLGTHVVSNENNVSSSLDVVKSPLQPPPPTSPPPLPPPPPPLPPLPAAVSGSYIPEPYNPEAPAMNITSPGDMPNYWMPSNIHIPSIHHSRSQPPSLISNNQHMMPQHNSKPRTRELIGVPTVEVTDSNKSISLKPVSTFPTMKKRKGFDFTRLGPKPKRPNSELSRTLELKRVPKHLNTIALLNSHFSKFGNITNIEVFYNGDPEAALIQFQNHMEAARAHNSTDAVLNNRFIQVFWHKKDNGTFNKTEQFNIAPPKYQPHLKEVMSNNSEISNEEKFPSSSRVFNAEKSSSEKVPERSVVYSRGNICRTVFNPTMLKKTDNTPSVSSTTSQKEDKKVNKKLELYKKKQDFLDSQMKHQQLILTKLSTAKNEEQRTLLKGMLETLGSKIKECQSDLKDFLKQCNSQKTTTPLSKSEAEKMLLDAELDLYKTLNKCDGDKQEVTTESLILKVNELKQQAKAFGLLDSSVQKPHDVGLKAKRRPSQYSKSNNSMSLKIDNRPKTLLVSGLPDKDAVKKLFQQFGDLEKIEDHKSGFTVTYKTRKMAEMAFTRSKLGDENLSVSWLQADQHPVSEDVKDANVSKLESEEILFADGEEDEDEEEDSEARSWRR